MNRSVVGWLWVAAQAVLLLAIVALPGRSDWPTPAAVELVAQILFFGGLVLVIVAALGLGRALTPTPVPVSYGSLTTGGLYRFVRHPIYTGVLAVVAGMTLRSGSVVHLAVAAAALVFFDRKAAWEEQQLARTYPDYDRYAASTPKFIPRPWRL